jgi:hypothetical protein
MPEIAKMTDPEALPPSIYFGGCAFGSAFYVGVYKAMAEKWGPKFHENVFICGDSAGAIFAIGIALNKNPEFMNDMFKTVSRKSLTLGYINKCSEYCEVAIKSMIDDNPMSYKELNGKCCFGTTSLFSKHRWHISWASNEDLLYTAISSLHIPLLCKANKRIKSTHVLDGAYSFCGKCLPHGDDTLYVGIDPHAEITRTFTNTEMLYPPELETYEKMVETGYRAFLEWDGRLHKKVGYRQPNYEALSVLWPMKIMEVITFRTLQLLWKLYELVMLCLSYPFLFLQPR